MNPTRSFNFRRATLSEAGLIVDLGARTFRASFGADNTPEDMEHYLSSNFSVGRIQTLLADPAAIFILVEEQGETVGYAMLYAGECPGPMSDPRALELVRIYVEVELTGRGYGSALMEACIDEAKRGGHKTIWLGVWERNHRAIRFYEQCGFSKVGEKKFVLGNDVQNDFIMERPVEVYA